MSYWDDEQPVMIKTPGNVLRWFKRADRLQVSLPDYTDAEGEYRQGKTVTVRLDVLHEADEEHRAALAECLRSVLDDVEA